MQIKLYKNLSDQNEINKYLVLVDTIDAKLKENTSIQNPVLMLKIDASDIADLNYLEIADFGRKYFITDKISVANGLWEVYARVDVLESFKNEILSLNAVIERQENVYNVNQPDPEFNVYANPILETWAFSAFEDNAYYLATSQAAE